MLNAAVSARQSPRDGDIYQAETDLFSSIKSAWGRDLAGTNVAMRQRISGNSGL